MKIAIGLYVFFVLIVPNFAQTAKPGIDGINWLGGCWESNQSGRISRERWTNPLGKMMLSTAQMVKNGKTVSFEYLRIVEDDSGLYYISKPSQNKEETSFKLVKFSEYEVIFENPEHDFPQRIIYRLEKDKSLLARIEGKNKGKDMGIDFPMQRVKCE